MKYVILVCDGASDWPIKELGDKTIMEAANTPNMDYIAKNGMMGLLQTIPDSCHPGSECANLAILGYNPETDLTGRGPLEALSAGVKLKEEDIAFRCNLITIEDDLIKDYSSGHITTEESTPLIEYLQTELNEEGVDFFPGIQYRHILRLDGMKYSELLNLSPPHDHMEQPYKDVLVSPVDVDDIFDKEKSQLTSKFLNELIEKSHPLLVNHEINKKRSELGKRMASHIWPWGGGKTPKILPLHKKYPNVVGGVVISAVDLIFGIGIAAGLKPIHIEGATGLPNTNYEGKANAGLDALKDEDVNFVYLHVEATDEMGHAGDVKRKIKALEDFDEKIVKPFIEFEKQNPGQLSIAILPDHPTPCELRTHTREPVPFAIYNPLKIDQNTTKNANESCKFTENDGKKGKCGILTNGDAFMRVFLDI